MTLRACYRKLELQPGASLGEIKRAYRRLAGQWHPDRYPGEPLRQKAAEERFKVICAAYERLRAASPQERAALKPSSTTGHSLACPPARRSSAYGARSSAPPAVARRRDRGAVNRGRGADPSPREAQQQSPARTGPVWGRPTTAFPGSGRSTLHRSGPPISEVVPGTAGGRAWLKGGTGIALVAGAVGVFCLGVLGSTTLAQMLAWAAMWGVIAAGAFGCAARKGR